MKRLILAILACVLFLSTGAVLPTSVSANENEYVKIVSPTSYSIINPHIDLSVVIETNIKRIGQVCYRVGFLSEQTVPFVPASSTNRYTLIIPSEYLLSASATSYYYPLRIKIVLFQTKYSWSDPGDTIRVRIPSDLLTPLKWELVEDYNKYKFKVTGIKASTLSKIIPLFKERFPFSDVIVEKFLISSLREYLGLLSAEKKHYTFGEELYIMVEKEMELIEIDFFYKSKRIIVEGWRWYPNETNYEMIKE